MSFNSYVAWQVRREQNEERLREVERYRRVRQALAARQRQVWTPRRQQGWTARSERDRVLIRALTWLGRCLVVWGQRLQERYGVVVEVSTVHAVNRAQN